MAIDFIRPSDRWSLSSPLGEETAPFAPQSERDSFTKITVATLTTIVGVGLVAVLARKGHLSRALDLVGRAIGSFSPSAIRGLLAAGGVAALAAIVVGARTVFQSDSTPDRNRSLPLPTADFSYRSFDKRGSTFDSGGVSEWRRSVPVFQKVVERGDLPTAVLMVEGALFAGGDDLSVSSKASASSVTKQVESGEGPSFGVRPGDEEDRAGEIVLSDLRNSLQQEQAVRRFLTAEPSVPISFSPAHRIQAQTSPSIEFSIRMTPAETPLSSTVRGVQRPVSLTVLDRGHLEVAVQAFERQAPGVTEAVLSTFDRFQRQFLARPSKKWPNGFEAGAVAVELFGPRGAPEGEDFLQVRVRQETVFPFRTASLSSSATQKGHASNERRGGGSSLDNGGLRGPEPDFPSSENSLLTVFVPLMGGLPSRGESPSFVANHLRSHSQEPEPIFDDANPSDHHDDQDFSGQDGGNFSNEDEEDEEFHGLTFPC